MIHTINMQLDQGGGRVEGGCSGQYGCGYKPGYGNHAKTVCLE